ncbi:hypothetical protein OAT62_06260, partial [Gammaproteobacteria bacterium]|nr:hypothetical protein [Gammaproteobacteria bacterium]
QVQALQAILALHQPVPQAVAVPLVVVVPLVAVPLAVAVVPLVVVVPQAVAVPHHQALRKEVQLACKAQQDVLMSIWQVLLGFRMTNQQTIN